MMTSHFNSVLIPPTGPPLVVGLPQYLSVTVTTGPGSVGENSILEISSSSGLSFLPVQSGTAWLSSTLENQESITSKPYALRTAALPRDEDDVDRSVAIVTLPACGPYEKVVFDLVVQAPLCKQSEQAEEVQHQVRSAGVQGADYLNWYNYM